MHREHQIHLPGRITTMRCASEGTNRPAVVFLHGLLGDSTQWHALDRPYAPASYANTYYIDFHFEQRRASSMTWGDIVSDVVALLERGPGLRGQLTLVGSSFGGHLALYLAAHGYADPEGLVLFAPGGIPEVSKQRGLLQSYRTIDKILDVSFERIFNDPSMAHDPRIRASAEEYKRRIDPYKRDLGRNLIELSRHMREATLSHHNLRQIRARTLLVWGRRDMVTPPELCDIFARHIPRSRVAWMNSGHAAHFECSTECSEALRDFCLEYGEYAEALSAVSA